MGDAPLNPSRLANRQGFRPPPPTLHDLQMDKGLGPPPPHPSRLANGQGLRAPQPFMTWGRPPNGQGLGPPPNPSRLANGQGLPPQPFTTCRWTRVGGPNPSRLANGRGLGAPPTLHDLQTSNFVWTSIGASKPSNA